MRCAATVRGGSDAIPGHRSGRESLAADGFDPLLCSRTRVDRIDHRTGIRSLPARTGDPVPCVPGAIPVCRLAAGRLGAAAHDVWVSSAAAPFGSGGAAREVDLYDGEGGTQ